MNRVTAISAALLGLWFLLAVSPRSAGEDAVKFGFGAVLLIFAYQRFQASPGKTASYTRIEEAPWLRIETVPAASPVNWFAALLSIVFGAGIVGSGVAYLWVIGLIFAGIAALVLLRDPRGSQASRRSRFGVGSPGIEVGGQLLRKEDIQQLAIRNRFGGAVDIIYDMDRGLPTGVLAGMAHRRKTAEVAYRVEVDVIGKVHVLAAGLDEVTARGIADEVGKILYP